MSCQKRECPKKRNPTHRGIRNLCIVGFLWDEWNSDIRERTTPVTGIYLPFELSRGVEIYNDDKST